ncbi:Recombination protein RecR [Alloiococcus otitis]|uniref:Recombination protein RecR n=2 Tax=Alloiococcus TaxID=1651 RepID=K9E820_9LACT|nr:recombination protein recR [Alloiococcus otitis ATCC 51267]SUU81551.1 Recombination protein RecR [Alloiococcus otitis]
MVNHSDFQRLRKVDREGDLMQYPQPIARLMDSYMKLPGIGEKTAARLAFYTVKMREEDVTDFAKALISVQRDLTYCSICGNMTEEDPCSICSDDSRDQSTILVVEQARDVLSMEKMSEYKGLYHVLHGILSPVEGTGPEDINIADLIKRLQENEVEEVIIATNATAEGEATAMYLSRLIKPSGIKVTRLAHGLSVGSDIEYADEITLLKAVEGRREM